VRRRLNGHITKQAKREFYLRRQVQCAGPLKVAASQKGLSEARLHRFLRFWQNDPELP